MSASVTKALGAQAAILTRTRDLWLEVGKWLDTEEVVNVSRAEPVVAVKRLTGGTDVHRH
jgi:L-iditol 2-dehydrogenase